MKRMILTLAIAVSSLGVFAADVTVSEQVLRAFNTEFVNAREVQWSLGSNYYKAAFMQNERYVFAYYNLEGKFLGVTRYVSPADLPIGLQTALKKKYADYWVSDLFEVAKSDASGYYVTLENADSKIVLKSEDVYGWTLHEKTRKL